MKKRPTPEIIVKRAERIWELAKRPQVSSVLELKTSHLMHKSSDPAPHDLISEIAVGDVVASLGLIDDVQFVGTIEEIVLNGENVEICVTCFVLTREENCTCDHWDPETTCPNNEVELWHTVTAQELYYWGLVLVVLNP